MNNWQSRARYVTIAFLLFSTFILMVASRTEAASDEFYLSIVGLKYDSTERISAFDFQVQGGQIVGAPRIPLG